MTAARRGAVLVIALLLAVWWGWPSLAGHDAKVDVLVVGDPFLELGRRSIELRFREEGRSVRWSTFDEAWCRQPAALAGIVAEEDPTVVVLPVPNLADCPAALVSAVGGREAIAVVEPGIGADAAAATAAAGFDVVDPERLVGRPGDDPRRPCEWWETCDADGNVVVREAAGALTPEGGERVARMIVAAARADR